MEQKTLYELHDSCMNICRIGTIVRSVQKIFICSKSTIETLEKGVEYS